MSRIGIVGFGAMGSRIAKNLIEAGHEVKGYNRNPQKVESVAGVQLVGSPSQAADNVECLIVMVRDDAASQWAWTDPQDGILQSLAKDTVAIDMSTLSYAWVAELSQQMQTLGYEFLEAPVGGTRPQADAKQLTVLCAGSESAFLKAKGTLDATAGKMLFLGESGRACALKLVINSLFGIQTLAFAEMTQALRKVGFDDSLIAKILPELPVTSPIMKMMLTLMMEGNFTPQFPIELVAKDFDYSRDFVSSLGLRPLMSESARDIFKLAEKEGLGDRNISAAIRLFD